MKRSNSLSDIFEPAKRQQLLDKALSIRPATLAKDTASTPSIIQMGNEGEGTTTQPPKKETEPKSDSKKSTPPAKSKKSDAKASTTDNKKTASKGGKKQQAMQIPLPMLLQMMGGAANESAKEKEDADINGPDKESGKTPLHYIIENGWNELIAPAILTGADPGKKDNNGDNAFHLAAKQNKPLALLSLYETVIKIASLAEKEGKQKEMSESAQRMYI